MNTKIKGIMFDLDGTIYLGENALPGAVKTIRYLRTMNKHVLFVTNKPLQHRQSYAEKLCHLGIPATPDDILTSGYVLADYLSRHHRALDFYALGEQPLIDELRNRGLNIINELNHQDPLKVIDAAGINAVIVAFDRTVNYRKLNTAYQALLKGAHFFATNADKACPMPGGSIPDAGASIAALEHISGRKVEFIAGKPSTYITEVAVRKLDINPEECLVVGDRLETDILMGQNAGMTTALVLTGASSQEDLTGQLFPPDFVLKNIGDLRSVLTDIL